MYQPTTPSSRKHKTRLTLLFAVVALVFSGCAAFTNPVANGIPVRLLPEEMLAESREQFEPIDLAMLRIKPTTEYKLAAGDTLGIYVEGIIGDATTPPPVNLPSSPDEPPAIGFPFPIRSDGTISLPLVDPISLAPAGDAETTDVDSLTIEQAEERVVSAYKNKKILRADEQNPRIIVTLLRRRTVRVLVVREDGSTPQITVRNQSLRGLGSSSTTLGGGGGSTGNALELPVGQNDVLTALTSTGGLPGPASTQEVLIYRGYASGDSFTNGAPCSIPDPSSAMLGGNTGQRVIRIPLRKRCGTRLSIPEEDITLQDGDIVTIRARVPEFYYTGGLLPASELSLPIEYDLNVVEAVIRSQGPLINGGINGNNLNGAIVGGGIGNPSPSQLTVLRKLPNGQQIDIIIDLNEALRDPRLNLLVQADDVLLLQENRDEAFARYFSNSVFQSNFFFRFINRNDAQGTATLVLP